MIDEDFRPRKLKLTIERSEDTVLVYCVGHLVAGETDLLEHDVKPLVKEVKRVVLDLSGLTKMDSMGLGTLVHLHMSARLAGSRLELANLGEKIWQLLGVAKLLSVFTIVGEKEIRM